MLRKHWLFPILLLVLVYVYAVCPLFCAAFGQMLCENVSEKMQMTHAETGASCCHKTDTTDNSENPAQDKVACCLTDLDLILPNDSHNGNAMRESLGQQIVSIVPFFTTGPTDQEILLHLPIASKLFTALLNSDISRRGPPYTCS